MPVVQHHVTRPDGSPAVLLDVHIDLITGDQSRTAFRRSDRTGLAARIELTPDGDGWSADLVPLTDVQPTGSVYRVTEHIDGAPRAVWHFQVPAVAGPHDLVDLLCDPPDGPQAVIVGNGGIAIRDVQEGDTETVVLVLADGRQLVLTGTITALPGGGFGFTPFGTAPFGGAA